MKFPMLRTRPEIRLIDIAVNLPVAASVPIERLEGRRNASTGRGIYKRTWRISGRDYIDVLIMRKPEVYRWESAVVMRVPVSDNYQIELNHTAAGTSHIPSS